MLFFKLVCLRYGARGSSRARPGYVTHCSSETEKREKGEKMRKEHCSFCPNKLRVVTTCHATEIIFTPPAPRPNPGDEAKPILASQENIPRW